jgi:hypothetical protein
VTAVSRKLDRGSRPLPLALSTFPALYGDLSPDRLIHTLANGVSDSMNIRAARSFALATAIVVLTIACSRSSGDTPSSRERAAIADSLKHLVTNAYDLSKPNAVARLMSLYPTQGPVISANSGQATTTRAALQSQIETFWRYVGSNMRNPKWVWTSMHIDVLSRDAAVMTATYQIPHLNPHNLPHVIGGAWTAVFVRRDGKWVVIQEHLSDAPPMQM